MATVRRTLALILSFYLVLGPHAEHALAAVDAETTADLLTSGKAPSGAGALASGLESFKTDLYTGSAHFSVPLQVPPGTAGMQPNLALKYDSKVGNGWVGFGWKLDLSRISRRTQKGTPTYNDSTDVFQLNDNKLVKDTSGNYHTEVESFFQIKHLVNGTIDNGWQVISKNGRQALFGTSANSRIVDPANEGHIFAWLLDEVKDPFGNSFKVAY